MMDFKVEWVNRRELWQENTQDNQEVPVVRLAEIKKLIQEAEKFAKNVVRNGRRQADEYVEAQGFLHRVAAWRTGQEGT
jgi:hypothetical protein